MLKIRPKKNSKEDFTNENKINEKVEVIILLQLELIPLKSQNTKRKNNATAWNEDIIGKDLEKTSSQLFAMTMIIIAIIPKILLSQKSCYSIGNLHISNK